MQQNKDNETLCTVSYLFQLSEPVMLHPHVVGNFTQRLWAYLTIKELLKKRLISDDAAEKEELEERALDLSLKYHFVTPLTSLVVVKPDGSNDTTSKKTKENERDEADLMIPASAAHSRRGYMPKGSPNAHLPTGK